MSALLVNVSHKSPRHYMEDEFDVDGIGNVD